MSKPLIFFGTEDFSAISLQGLIDAGYDIAAVVTKPDFRRGRKQIITQPVVKKIALEYHIPVWQPQKLSEIYKDVEQLQPIAGVLVSYGKIIPKSLIELFSPGIINVHPSLLPRYRGPSPIEAAIKNGDQKTGITIMQLDAKMDAGPIYAQEGFSLSGSETKPELYQICGEHGKNLLLKVLPNILNGSLLPTPQDESQATYCQLLNKRDSRLSTSDKSATELEREIRAYRDYPKSRYTIHNVDITILTAQVVEKKDDTKLILECRGTTFLEILTLIAPSGRTMSGEEFLRGYKK